MSEFSTGIPEEKYPIVKIPNWIPYLYEMWCIADANNVDVAIGCDMFMANVRSGSEEYPGCKGIGWESFKKVYDECTEDARNEAFLRLTKFRQDNYLKLVEFYRNKDEDSFRKFCIDESTIVYDDPVNGTAG